MRFKSYTKIISDIYKKTKKTTKIGTITLALGLGIYSCGDNVIDNEIYDTKKYSCNGTNSITIYYKNNKEFKKITTECSDLGCNYETGKCNNINNKETIKRKRKMCSGLTKLIEVEEELNNNKWIITQSKLIENCESKYSTQKCTNEYNLETITGFCDNETKKCIKKSSYQTCESCIDNQCQIPTEKCDENTYKYTLEKKCSNDRTQIIKVEKYCKNNHVQENTIQVIEQCYNKENTGIFMSCHNNELMYYINECNPENNKCEPTFIPSEEKCIECNEKCKNECGILKSNISECKIINGEYYKTTSREKCVDGEKIKEIYNQYKCTDQKQCQNENILVTLKVIGCSGTKCERKPIITYCEKGCNITKNKCN